MVEGRVGNSLGKSERMAWHNRVKGDSVLFKNGTNFRTAKIDSVFSYP
jgi:hypothetical protein